MPILIRDLIEGRPNPITISWDASLAQAHQLMDEYDFSQLPVIGRDERLLGLVTAETMLRALTSFKLNIEMLRVHDALLPVRPIEADGDLFQLLERLAGEYAVVVTDQNAVMGIVTAFDTSTYFRKRAEDIMIVEDIERRLREYILLAFPSTPKVSHDKALHEAVQRALTPPYGLQEYKKSLRAYCSDVGGDDPKNHSEAVKKAFEIFTSKTVSERAFDDMTMFETVEVFLAGERWSEYAVVVPLETRAIRTMFDTVRSIRNKLAHFKGDISGAEHQRLIQCRNWLDSYRSDLYAKFRPQEQFEKQETDREVQHSAVSPEFPDLSQTERGRVKARGKYSGLYAWLRGVPSDRSYTWIDFDKIESLIKDKLPPSARQGRTWWANDSTSRVQSREWLNAGFRVEDVDLASGRVLFRRIEARPRATIAGTYQVRLQDVLAEKGEESKNI